MSQSIRNKIYGVVSALIPALVILGLVTADQADQALSLTDNGLALATAVIAWGTNVMAFVKSLPSKVAVVPVPVAEVETVNGRSVNVT